MKRWIFAAALLCVVLPATQASAYVDCRVRKYTTAAQLLALTAPDCTFGYALDSDVMYLMAGGSWTALSTLTTLAGANGGTFVNSTNNKWTLGENSEDFTFDFSTGNQLTLSSSTGVATLLTGLDLSLSGGANALAFTAASSSVVVPNNSATGLILGSSGLTNLLTLDTTTDLQKLIVTGTTTATAFHVDVGNALFDELLSIGGGAGALTFTNSAASVLTGDNDTSALDIGSAGLTNAMRYSSQDNKEIFTVNAGMAHATHDMGGASATLDESDCGKTVVWDAGDDGFTATLPATVAGCQITFVYVGADGGALVDISPNASDGIYGGCTLAASVVSFSGTDDADVGITKATIKKGDNITLMGDGVDGWVTTSALGICANN